MKKLKILVMATSVEIGGIEKSLIGLLDSFDYDKYDVDLFLYKHSGELLKNINPKVNLLPQNLAAAASKDTISYAVKHGNFLVAFLRLYSKIICGISSKITGKNSSSMIMANKFISRFLPKFTKKYDLAVGFSEPFYYMLNKVDAAKKIGWIHTDYSQEPNTDYDVLYDEYKDLDYIVAVSAACKSTFSSLLPKLTDKIVTIENILPQKLIEIQSNDTITNTEMDDNCIKLLSIGRFCYAKNFDNIPEILSNIRKKGINAKWYLIGFGQDESLIKQKIAEFKIQDYVIVLGKKENPYPYIKACDIYLQTSRYEGKCVAVREAQMLGKPVIITDYPTSSSQLEDGIDGIVVPLDNIKCAEAISNLIKNEKLQKSLIENCNKRDYSNADEIKKLYKIIEN